MGRALVGIWLACALWLQAATVVFLGASADSEIVAEAFRGAAWPQGVAFETHCLGVEPLEALRASARRADVLIVNARSRELRALAAGVDTARTRLYALHADLLPPGVKAQEPAEVKAYRANRRPENFLNLARWVVRRELGVAVEVASPVTLPSVGAAHPAAGRIFARLAEWQAWAKEAGHFQDGAPTVAFAVHAASVTPAELALFRNVTDECERQGLNCVVVFGDEVRVIRELLLRPDGTAAVDAVLALSFKFKAGLGAPLNEALRALGVPVFNALRLYRQTTAEWKRSPTGMNDFSVAFGFIAPETSGLIEPSLLFGVREVEREGRKAQVAEPFPGAVRQTVARLKGWARLRRLPNAEKRVALFVYNGYGGKQNIGASYLNVPRSLVAIVHALAADGYRTGGLEGLDEAAMAKELLKSARNVGPWAPGELDEFLAHGEAVRLPMRRYREWYAALPEALRRAVEAEWGAPEQARAMARGGDFILPMLRRGNVVILPEPMRGWLDDPHKLAHSATLAPPHQYLAVYLWLQREFGADAMVHLGRHGSSEWLPGKQLGLATADAPMAVRGAIPEIYPYISDGIGEGIVAKRRAQAVMIDHLTPLLKESEAEGFLPELKRRIGECQSADPGARPAREEALRAFAVGQGLGERLALQEGGWFARLEDYAESRAAAAPFGLHAFGVSPSKAEAQAMAAALPEARRAAAEAHLASAGEDELRALRQALSGGFVPPGPSGDPLRNPAVLPVGRNFYSFDPAKAPTEEAMRTGERLAAELLERERARLGRWPRSVAIVLWAGESIRTDGVNEALALALLGMRVRHDRSGRVAGVAPLPGAQLGRPRIDVLLTASGAYRDQFGETLRLLDEARRQAARLADAENFIQGGTPGVFFPAPGTYGTRVNRLAGASGHWESDDELSALYLRNMAWTVGEDGGFERNQAGLEAGAKAVEAVLHSRSSNVYGVTDIDDMYQYFGGLSLAVRKASGRAPEGYIADQRKAGAAGLSGLRGFLAAEMDARMFSKPWLQAMMGEGYAGAKTLARMADNVWGWQAVTPEVLTAADWNDLYEVYVQDRHGVGVREFFAEHNEWAFQSMAGRMLEAVRKDYWSAPMTVRQRLAAEYAKSVIRQGMACCDHTCNNPLLNQMVVNLISMPGVLSPDLAMKFQAAVEKAAGKRLGDQVRERRALQRELAASFGVKSREARAAESSAEAAPQEESARAKGDAQPVKGFRMKPREREAEKTSLASSGLKWTILVAVFGVIALVWAGMGRGE